ncbi:hypothetical protein CB0940_10085 [Cercospora beticola]|uniref:Zn(2)-C6 fungal-type domain-containing protein n=1 Tax=Cercospora beticola TaxID=122368 RepID=A0A2G5HTM5_CERBT|nr:hypothetical protein CB0940_10085 [Cercospora beticola]PIA95875.1 hypothetical protein CB0940_10085 [Cercospora beticola]WPB06787.1 hypothetical protein RHO25_011447 [Cercospora beticola]
MRTGCRQCSKRRITCDLHSPVCQKCATKGLECSGIGFQWRFVDGVAKRAKRTIQEDDGEGRVRKRVRKGEVGRGLGERRVGGEEDCAALREETGERGCEVEHTLVQSSSLPADETEDATLVYQGTPASRSVALPVFDLSSALLLEPLKPGISMLFNHFSTHIAPAMVAFETDSNGYRHLVLPIAMQDELVQNAVCVVSAFHLGLSRSQASASAEAGRSAIIRRLRANVAEGDDARVFNYSTLMTLLVLLVGETVTGSSEFAYLFNMLAATVKDGRAIARAPPETREFLVQQTRMFELFTPAFIDSEAGMNILGGNLDSYLGWLLTCQTSNPAWTHLIAIYKHAIELARDIYLLEKAVPSSRDQIQSKVTCVRSLTEQIGIDTPGMHCLVWAYFIAAASSTILTDRHYFEVKLREIYRKTRMNNILAALESLERIWQDFPNGGWNLGLGTLRPVLPM